MKRMALAMACGLMLLAGCTGGGANDSSKAAGACDGSCKEQACQNEGCESSKASMQLQLNLVRKVKPECVSAFIASFQKCKESTVKEPGCIDYAIYQSVEDSTVLFIAETWANEGELAKHGETAHLRTHLEEVKDMGDPNAKGNSKRIYICPMVNK